jgi:hypothetical protein
VRRPRFGAVATPDQPSASSISCRASGGGGRRERQATAPVSSTSPWRRWPRWARVRDMRSASSSSPCRNITQARRPQCVHPRASMLHFVSARTVKTSTLVAAAVQAARVTTARSCADACVGGRVRGRSGCQGAEAMRLAVKARRAASVARLNAALAKRCEAATATMIWVLHIGTAAHEQRNKR